MVRHQHIPLRVIARRLRLTSASLAAAAAVYDPSLLLHLKAWQRGQGSPAPSRPR
jgi:hypothetical protein